MRLQQSGGSQLQGEHESPVLPFGPKLRRLIVEKESQVVSMRPHAGLAEPGVVGLRSLQLTRKVAPPSRSVFQPDCFARSADRIMRGGHRRLKLCDQTRPPIGYRISVSNQRLVKCRDLAPARSRSFQQQIPRPQRTLVVTQGPAVTWLPLRSNEVEETPAHFTRTANYLDVAIGEIDKAADLQILLRGFLLHLVEGELLSFAAEVKLKATGTVVAVDSQTTALVLNHIGEPRHAWRLEPKENASRLEQSRFALRIWSDDDVEPRSKFRLERCEAAEMAEFQRAQHLGAKALSQIPSQARSSNLKRIPSELQAFERGALASFPSALSMNPLPGFRDFYPDDCARRNYILHTWREVARRYGFSEYDGPVLEPIELYRKKSGGELVGQLFDFTDKGKREVAMRPEMTPTLARMVAARERDFRKPLKWFCLPQFFRYEKQQRGRLREFYQLNCDIIGEPSVAADAELIALLIDVLRGFGFDETHFVVRVSDRNAWLQFATARGVSDDRVPEFLAIIDKMERASEAETSLKLAELGVTLDAVREFLRDPSSEATGLKALTHDLEARGLGRFVEVDLTIVRGLAYYTGFVFEVFDRAKKERALAGGGRYDQLLHLMSDGKTDLPALGFGMGDVVLANMIDDTAPAKTRMDAWIASQRAADIYVVIAKEERRADALAAVQQLRDAGLRVEYPLGPTKIGKQFQAAEQLGAHSAALFGDEWPQVKVKALATREETLLPASDLVGWSRTRE